MVKFPFIQRWFVVQWHVTDLCGFRCRYCYIPHEYKTGKKRRELSYEEIIRIIDELDEFAKEFGLRVRINFTGGDPLLREDFFEIARYARRKGFLIGILGNPVLDEEKIKELKRLPVFRYQISIDGLKKTHEWFRGKGTWKLAIDSLRLLGEYGITRVVLTTISKINYKEVPPLIEYLYRNNLVEIYDFSEVIPVGEGVKFWKYGLSAEEFRWLLHQVYMTYKRLWEEGIRTHIGTKEPLWMLMYHDLGILRPEVYTLKRVRGGCSIGWWGLVIDVDGKVYPCRRLPVVIGNVKEQSIRDIFFYSPKLNEMRQVDKITPCNKCLLRNVCRGCRAIAWATSRGDYYAPDPRCWKVVEKVI